MKEKRAKLNAKKKLENEKLQLKQERLRLLEEQNEKQRKNIIKKLNKMEKKKLELDKKKDEFYQQIKQGLNMKVQGTKVNKNSLTKEADAKRDEILEYESYVFGLVKSKEAGNNNKNRIIKLYFFLNAAQNSYAVYLAHKHVDKHNVRLAFFDPLNHTSAVFFTKDRIKSFLCDYFTLFLLKFVSILCDQNFKSVFHFMSPSKYL